MDFNKFSVKVRDLMTKNLEDISYENKKNFEAIIINPVIKLAKNQQMVEKRAQYLKKRF